MEILISTQVNVISYVGETYGFDDSVFGFDTFALGFDTGYESLLSVSMQPSNLINIISTVVPDLLRTFTIESDIVFDSDITSNFTCTFAGIVFIVNELEFKRASIYIKEYFDNVYIPIYKYMLPGLSIETTTLNFEIYNVYNLLTSLANGGIFYNTFKIVYNESLDSLDFYYKDQVVMRFDNQGNLYTRGVFNQNQTY